jgi:hypothetical protein
LTPFNKTEKTCSVQDGKHSGKRAQIIEIDMSDKNGQVICEIKMDDP